MAQVFKGSVDGKMRNETYLADPNDTATAIAALIDELAACRSLPPHGYEVNRTGQFDIHIIDGQKA